MTSEMQGIQSSPRSPGSSVVTSSQIPEPPDFIKKPKLSDFSYKDKNLPSDPAAIDAQPPNVKKTIHMLEAILLSKKADIALAFLVKNKVPYPEPAPCTPANSHRTSTACSSRAML